MIVLEKLTMVSGTVPGNWEALKHLLKILMLDWNFAWRSENQAQGPGCSYFEAFSLETIHQGFCISSIHFFLFLFLGILLCNVKKFLTCSFDRGDEAGARI